MRFPWLYLRKGPKRWFLNRWCASNVLMKTTAVTANAYQLTRLGFVNCYLVRESDGLSLIDAGLPGGANDILAAAQSLGAPIRRILLTHAHADHVGSVDALVEKLGTVNLELVASARTVPLLQKPPNTGLEPGEPQGKVKGGVPGIKSRPTQLLAEGGLIGSLRTIETPGHMPGHLSFLDERDGTLYAGDALIGKGRLTISGFSPWFFPLPNFATWDKTTALASARKLLDFQIERFASGHGAVQPGGRSALTAAIAEATS
jgi:glyoxylase-like metal-dependent hydrolase (beta-lactamase superfamily II)